MESAEIERVLSDALPRRVPDLVAAYLFGSFGRGEPRSTSDVDVALLYKTPPAPTLIAQPFVLAGDLSALVGRTVDLVVLNSAPVDLVHRVFRDGKLLVERDRSLRIAFEVRARNEYFDFLPVLRRYRRQTESF